VYADPWIFPFQPTAPGWLPRYIADDDVAYVSGLTVNAGRRLFDDGGRLQSVPAVDPATEAAVSLRDLLARRGITVDGAAGAVTRPPPTATGLGAVASPPLVELLRHMVRESDNHIADAVFRTLGREVLGDATWAGGSRAVVQALTGLGLDLTGIAVVDGSGLSRDDRLTPAFLVALDLAMTRSDLGGIWQSLLSVAGANGTLEKRFVGSLAAGRLLGKTGSLRDVRTLAGQVHDTAGLYHFAVLANGLDGDAKRAVEQLQDHVAVALARDLHGCFLAPVPGC
jgi:D-alanyl-D-alanine carboxypeptidase/D-alanyl-D-alanine-endopeptidase (penicillin-binding protein 4)